MTSQLEQFDIRWLPIRGKTNIVIGRANDNVIARVVSDYLGDESGLESGKDYLVYPFMSSQTHLLIRPSGLQKLAALGIKPMESATEQCERDREDSLCHLRTYRYGDGQAGWMYDNFIRTVKNEAKQQLHIQEQLEQLQRDNPTGWQREWQPIQAREMVKTGSRIAKREVALSWLVRRTENDANPLPDPRSLYHSLEPSTQSATGAIEALNAAANRAPHESGASEARGGTSNSPGCTGCFAGLFLIAAFLLSCGLGRGCYEPKKSGEGDVPIPEAIKDMGGDELIGQLRRESRKMRDEGFRGAAGGRGA